MKPAADLDQYERLALRMLQMAPFVRRPGGWRFGARRITDTAVERLVALGHAVRNDSFVWPVRPL